MFSFCSWEALKADMLMGVSCTVDSRFSAVMTTSAKPLSSGSGPVPAAPAAPAAAACACPDNDATCLDEAHVPFGGLGASGLGGRSGGDANLTEFTEQRWVSLQRGAVEYPY